MMDKLYSTVAFDSSGYLFANQPKDPNPPDKLPFENRRMYRERVQKQKRAAKQRRR